MKICTFLPALFLLLLFFSCQKAEKFTLSDQTMELRNGNRPKVERPFKGWVSGKIPAPGGTCDFGGAVSGKLTGNLTHLGNTKVEYEGCAGFVAPQISVSAVEDQFRIRVEGEYIAPPLDTIIIITDFFTSTNDGTSEEQIEGTYSIIGGKGRFRGATGEGALQGRSSAQTRGLGVSLEFEGTIIY